MTPGTRSTATDLSQRFGAVWPEVERSVVRYLQSHGLTADAADDVAQEVAARALDRGVPFEAAEDLTAWCLVVARRLAVDEHRRQRRMSVVEVPEHTASVDVEREVAARQAWNKVAGLMAGLSADDRELLLDSAALPPNDRNRLYVRRHRLRNRLVAGSEGLVALLLWLRRRGAGVRPDVAAGLALVVPIVAVAGLGISMPADELPARTSPTAEQRAHGGTSIPTSTDTGASGVVSSDQPAEASATWKRWQLSTPAGDERGRIGEGEEGAPIACLHDDPVVPDTCVGRTDMVPTLIDSDEVLGP